MAKYPPLKCPSCGSEKVSPGFAKRKKNTFLRDGKIYCYDCNYVTDSKGKKEKLKPEWRAHDFNVRSEDG